MTGALFQPCLYAINHWIHKKLPLNQNLFPFMGKEYIILICIGGDRMLHLCAEHFTDILYKHNSLPENRKPVYVYGTELALSTSLSIVSILFISALCMHLLSGILFLLIFIGLRLFAGGYHAETYRKCFFISNSVFVVTFFISLLLDRWNNLSGKTFTLFISFCIIWTLAPIQNEHHPLSDTTYKKNKIIARALVLFISSLILLFYRYLEPYLSIIVASCMAVAVLMIIPKLKERRD